MAKFENVEIAEQMRSTAIYWDKNGAEYRARVLRRWAEELDPPAIKCAYSGCDCDGLFRLELFEHVDESCMVSFRCRDHVVSWMMFNAPYGSIKVDLL